MSKLYESKNDNKNNKVILKSPKNIQNIKCLICQKRIKIKKKVKINDSKQDNNHKNNNSIENNNENNKDNDNIKNNDENKNNGKQYENQNFINIFCNKCNNNEAEFECLNCDLILCIQCKLNHLMNPQFQTHKIKIYELNPNINFSQCPFHKLNYKYFCLDDNTPLCYKCASSLHQEHNIKLITEINDYYLENIDIEIKKGSNNIKNLKDLINSLNELIQKLEKEKNILIKQLEKNINDIKKIILSQKDIIFNQINLFFNKKKELIEKKISTLNLILQRFDYYRNYLMVK